VVGDAGLLVSPTDVDAIADGLERLWDDETLRATLGAIGKRRAAQFDWVSVARRTHAVYRQAVECAS
jgi:glycosyltransferase involved in cell wall biosynthesis